MDVTHVVWDWNGTLFDDVEMCVDVMNGLTAERGLAPLSDLAHYRRLFRFPVVGYYADLGFDTTTPGAFEAVAHEFVERYHAALGRCRLRPGAEDALAAVHAHGIPQVVVSATHEDDLRKQMAPFALGRWLTGARGITDRYAVGKAELARAWMAETGADPAGVLFVGDTEHDHEIADALGARCALVLGGHHDEDHLSGFGMPVLDGPADIPALLGAPQPGPRLG